MTSHHLLVTGGAGFIGSNFVHAILERHPKYQITVLDTLTYAGNRANLRAVEHHPGFRFIQGDICDPAAVARAIEGCDWLVNFAAETHVDRSIVAPNAFIKTDVEGTFVLLEAARKAKIERFLQISTDEVYGNARAPDGTSRPSLETDALMPLSPYAASKAGAERLAFSYWATYGLPIVITRCSRTTALINILKSSFRSLSSMPSITARCRSMAMGSTPATGFTSAITAPRWMPFCTPRQSKHTGRSITLALRMSAASCKMLKLSWISWTSRAALLRSCPTASAMCAATPSTARNCARRSAGSQRRPLKKGCARPSPGITPTAIGSTPSWPAAIAFWNRR